jgi:hypothetical protein
MKEILLFGYQNAPLEIMAYELQDYFESGKRPFDVVEYVKEGI